MTLTIDLRARDLHSGPGRRLDQPLLKAVGVRAGDPYRPRVLDATAGLGRDAAHLAAFGCTVTAMERHPEVFAALHEALVQSAGPFTLLPGDFLDPTLMLPQVDVVYLDPMYAVKRSAKPKLPLQQLAALVGDDADQDRLLPRALTLALRRVVVKRHPHAPTLNRAKPSLVFKGKSVRFDVYLQAAPPLEHRGEEGQ